MNGWHLAAASHADLDPILAIEQHSFQWPWGRISFEDELSCRNGYGFSVKANDANGDSPVIAYAFLRLIVDELHILKIAVTPIWRGRGIATWLLSRCFEMAIWYLIPRTPRIARPALQNGVNVQFDI